MRAVGLHTFGPPEVLQVLDVAEPQRIPGRMIVAVAAATVNPTDTLLRAGKQSASMTELTPPFIPGMEFAGHVHDIGDRSTALQLGQPVMGIVNPRRPEGGAQVERLSVDATSLVAVPDSLGLADAATIPMNGLTALKAVDALGLYEGVVLVTGGPGVVGGYAIQLAKHAGLTVVADAKDSDIDLLRDLGVDEIVPRGAGMAAAVRERFPAGADGLIDAAVIGDAAKAAVRDGGLCVSVRGLQGELDPRLRHVAVSVTQHANDTDALRELARVIADNIITTRVAHVLPIEQAAHAHALVERGGLRGRVVLTFDR